MKKILGGILARGEIEISNPPPTWPGKYHYSRPWQIQLRCFNKTIAINKPIIWDEGSFQKAGSAPGYIATKTQVRN